MGKASLPENEAQRLEALRSLKILDTPPEERFDRITRLAMHLFDVPIVLVALINDLLDVSRIDAGKIQLQRTSIDIVQLIREVANSLKPQIEEKAQHFNISHRGARRSVAAE